MQKTRLSEELLLITDQLMMAKERSEVIRIASEFTAIIEKLAALEKQGNEELRQQPKCITAIMKFTQQEISEMAITFKREFIANGLCAHVLKRPSGKRYNTFCYEIRYRSNGYCIRAASTDLAEAKRKFIAKTMPGEIEKYKVDGPKLVSGFSPLRDIFDEWYEYKHGSITDKELRRYRVDFDSLPKTLQKKYIEEIRTKDISNVMRDLAPRKYEQMRTLFNGIFKYAIASGIISHNPMGLIPFRRAERTTRESLTKAEIVAFLQKIKSPEFDPIRQGAYLLYFFGLRPCEIDEQTRREGNFLIARNRKRKNGKVEYKKIPIPKQAERLIQWAKPFTFDCTPWMQNKLFNTALGENDKTAYCLRHTFATICQEAAVPQEVVEVWIGDSPQRLIGRVYTHYSDEYMRTQMDKVKFPII